MGGLVATFPRHSEFAKAKAIAESLGLACQVLSPEPGFGRVGVPALVLEDQPRTALMGHGGDALVCSGWVDYRPASVSVPAHMPQAKKTLGLIYAANPFGADHQRKRPRQIGAPQRDGLGAGV